jgi:hypothetical protein
MMNRKQFFRNALMGGSAMALPLLSLYGQGDRDRLRVALIGTGLRGQAHLRQLLRRKDVEVIAICDIDERMLARTREILSRSAQHKPTEYTSGPEAWRDLLAKERLDAVLIATPWEWHTPMIIGALEAGVKYVGTEVVLGITLADHWKVVKAAERHGGHVMMLENVCYRRDVMAVLNMVRQGLFGELIHLQGGYQHDLRHVKFNDGNTVGGPRVQFGERAFSEARWRTQHSVTRNGDLYPTHGLGPIAHWININRGNRFTKLSSIASKARGLHDWIVQKGGKDHPNASVAFKLGDIVTTQIECANGETILLQHDTNLPRPYSLGFRVQGTKGLWMDVNKGVYIEGRSKTHDQWDDQATWFERYDHPLWKRWNSEASGAGHGGMDFFVIHAFVESARRGTATPMDVYDAAAWSAVTPLSEASIRKGGRPVDFPDFTQGAWKDRPPVFALDDAF